MKKKRKTLTNQQILDKGVRHLRKQGVRALDSSVRNHPNPKCVYRTYDGLRCGVGGLIPKKLYDPSIEGARVSDLLEPLNERTALLKKILDKIGVSRRSWPLLSSLQSLHDTYHPNKWEERFQEIAELYDLKLKPKRS